MWQDLGSAHIFEPNVVRWLAEYELDKGSGLVMHPDLVWKELCWKVLSTIGDDNGNPLKDYIRVIECELVFACVC